MKVFEGRRDQIDAVEVQLRSLLRALESLSKFRKDMGTASQELGDSLLSLAAIEVNRPVSESLTSLGGILKKMKDVHEKQVAFSSRIKVFQAWQSAESAFARKKDALERVKSTAKVRQDKISVGNVEVEEKLERQVVLGRKKFEETSVLLRAELDRYEKEKAFDFTTALQGFLGSMIETQKEIIGLYQSFAA
ncbi:Vacuolar protein sorting-associated protein 5 [Phlyctochytrium bullatum]|nr:Vacuolar protein sorting-associated protein 5 [Phlyctochytrium bullatum]